MKCSRVQDLMGAYLYGDLDPEDMKQVRLHMQECDRCAEDLWSRGAVVSAIDNNIPTLSDSDKDKMTWFVKGSVRAGQNRTIPIKLKMIRGLVVATVLLIGFAAGALIGVQTAKRQSNKIQQSVVKTEERALRKENSRARVVITPAPEDESETNDSQPIRNIRPPFATGMFRKSNPRQSTESIEPNQPMDILHDKEHNGSKYSGNQNQKLPGGAGLNDARTTD